MSESRSPAAATLLLLAASLPLVGCVAPAPAEPASSGPPSLRVAPPSYYSRTPRYRRIIIPAKPATKTQKAQPQTIIIERYYEEEPPPAASPRQREKAGQGIDEAQEKLRDVQQQLRDKFREMSPEVDQDVAPPARR